MATSITDNTDIVALEVLTNYDIAQLTTTALEDEDPDWETRHKRAWTKVLDHLALRPTPITESDLSDTSELEYAACYYVAYLACKAGRSDRHKEMAKEFYSMFEKEMAEVRPTLSDGSSARRGCYAHVRGARA